MDKTASKTEVSLDELMPLIRERIAQGQSVRFYPNGVSMLPMLRPKVDSVVLSAPPDKLKKYDLVLYQREDGSFVLHRIIEVGQTYSCVGDNQFCKESGLKYQQIIAQVTAFYRGDKRHSINELGYRLYCRFWRLYRKVRIVRLRLFKRLRKRG